MDVFVESGVGGHIDDAVQAWTFDPEFWGRCGQGVDETSAVVALQRELGSHAFAMSIQERIHGDELAFARDLQAAQSTEREQTKAILKAVRPRTIEVLESCTTEQLDWDDPSRQLPVWATWRTLRGMGWHIVDTERRYYLDRVGYRRPRTSDDLFAELRQSGHDTHRLIDELPADLTNKAGGEVWTTTKILRRLAWHERAELAAIETLALRAAAACS